MGRREEANIKKHGVTFAVASLVFDDPNLLLFVERVVEGEERWHAIGFVGSRLLLTVVHTYPAEDLARVVSARPLHKLRKEHLC
jgi:uncharacterized DUF497 family protein